ncbi:MAG: 30S ribosomal protein S6 [Planctomycetota bacterium]
MQATRVGTYEAMFLISQAEASDLAGVIEHIDHLFERSEAEPLALAKWDERRLAYEIDKQKRGVYLLGYFRCPTDKLDGFERDCNLSEHLMRVMVTKADHLTDEEIAARNGREDLAVEAKMRAERAAERDRSGTGGSVSLGAPVRDQAPAAQAETAPAEGEAPESTGDASPETPADTPAEKPAEQPPAE